MSRGGFLALVGAAVGLAAGCVERTVSIQSKQPDVIVVINDEEVGVTPVKFSFQYYGDYELILRKEGYETLRTHFRINAPWWQLPPIDLVSDALVARTIHDDHVLPPYELLPATQPATAELVKRAVEIQKQTEGH
jgi:hypothetical protein